MPLPPELITQIKKNIADAEKRIKILEPEIARAKEAGIDVKAEQKLLVELKKKVMDLKLQYARP